MGVDLVAREQHKVDRHGIDPHLSPRHLVRRKFNGPEVPLNRSPMGHRSLLP